MAQTRANPAPIASASPRAVGAAFLAPLRASWSPAAWWATSHVLLGAVIGVITAAIVLVLIALTVVLAVTLVLAAVTLVQLLIFNRLFTALQRSRFAAVLEVHIPPLPQRPDPLTPRWVLTEVRAGSTWRQLGYHVLAGVLGPVGGLVLIGTWSVGLILTAAFVMPGNVSALLPGGWASTLAHAVLTVTGLVLLFAAPWLARVFAGLDVALARTLLGPSRRDELARRVELLTASRAEVVEAADAERRRIERDLHDGTQQRLTSLALNLGIARATLTDLPEPAREAIVQAHDEAKEASAELRDFVRGMYPAVLHDRGLDAALSGIAARAPMPVRLRVDVPERATPTVEAIAYFVVSEALANAARHAAASVVDVTVERIGDRLHITVSDDGRGGAHPGGGSGLRGLAQRVRSVDGTLHVDSPAGGPTRIVAELPCAS